MRKGKLVLTPDDWADAALRAMAEGGVGAVAINKLAKELGATRGSFYWHFADRAALIKAALLRWERLGITDVVAEMEHIADPRLQLQHGYRAAFSNLEEGDIEAALSAHASDPLIAPFLERVAVARLRTLRQVYDAMGFDPIAAEDRARMTFAIYLGHFQLRRSLPGGREEISADYIDRLFGLLTEPPPGRNRRVPASERDRGRARGG
ncbi:MAG: TetR/AcrR family transcriptional regulator [Chloroflexota bacterium]|nr:TetR/AcrR family transcriptional regulator [Chloroflexota bacterium]